MTGPDERPARDAGMSLAELLVAMTLFTLIVGMVGTVAVITLRTTDGLQARGENTMQAELGVAAAGKVLRAAVLPEQLEESTCTGCEDTAVVVASPTRVTFYANVGDSQIGPSLVTLYVAADPNNPGTGKLVQETQPPLPAGEGSYTFCSRSQSGCRFTSRVAARGLLWPSPGVLSYYDYEGARIPGGGALSATDLPRISSVDLVMTVQRRPRDSRFPARTVVTRVRLPNVEINKLTEAS